MTILEKLRSKIRPTNETIPPPEPDMNGETVTPVSSEPPAAMPKVYVPIAVGEYLPWKGIVFKVSAVTENSFTAQVAGLTPARAKKMGRV